MSTDASRHPNPLSPLPASEARPVTPASSYRDDSYRTSDASGMTIIITGLGMMHVIPNVKTTLCEAEVLNTRRMQKRMAKKPVSSVRTRKFGRLQKYFGGSPTVQHSPRSIGNL